MEDVTLSVPLIRRQVPLRIATLPCLCSDITTRRYTCRYLNPHWLWLTFTLFLSRTHRHTHTQWGLSYAFVMSTESERKMKNEPNTARLKAAPIKCISNSLKVCKDGGFMSDAEHKHRAGRLGWKGFCLSRNSRFEMNENVVKPHWAEPTMHWNSYISIHLTHATNIR